MRPITQFAQPSLSRKRDMLLTAEPCTLAYLPSGISTRHTTKRVRILSEASSPRFLLCIYLNYLRRLAPVAQGVRRHYQTLSLCLPTAHPAQPGCDIQLFESTRETLRMQALRYNVLSEICIGALFPLGMHSYVKYLRV